MSFTVTREGDELTVQTDAMGGIDRRTALTLASRWITPGESLREVARVPGLAITFTITRHDQED